MLSPCQQTYCYYMHTVSEEDWPYMGIFTLGSLVAPLLILLSTLFPSSLETVLPVLRIVICPICQQPLIPAGLKAAATPLQPPYR